MGAVVAGLLADLFGMAPAIAVVGVITLLSGGVVAAAMKESLREEGVTPTKASPPKRRCRDARPEGGLDRPSLSGAIVSRTDALSSRRRCPRP